MRINTKKLEGIPVYRLREAEPCGKITGICLSKENGRVEGLIAETLSIVPIRKRISVNEIYKVTDKKIVIKEDFGEFKGTNGADDTVYEKDIVGVRTENMGLKKIKDIKFDFETGEITDIVIRRNLFNKKENLQVNKIGVKDNTIYIE